MKNPLTDAVLLVLLLVCIILVIHELRVSFDRRNNVSGVVYLLSPSGRVQISDFEGEPYEDNGYNTWFDKKKHKHWTKAPLMYMQE